MFDSTLSLSLFLCTTITYHHNKMLNIDTLPIYVALIALILIKGAAFAPTTSKEWTGTTYSSALAASTEPAPSFSSVARKFVQTAVPGPPLESKPDYENIVGPLGRFMDQIFMKVFRKQLAEQVGADSVYDDYRAIIDLASQMNRKIANRTEIHQRAEKVLINLFPSWMPVRAWRRIFWSLLLSR